jgi:hypothetical protein
VAWLIVGGVDELCPYSIAISRRCPTDRHVSPDAIPRRQQQLHHRGSPPVAHDRSVSAFARAKKFSTLNEVTRIATPPDRRDRHGYTSSTGPTVPQCCPQLVEVERHTGHGAHGAGIVPLDDCVGQGAQELKDELDSTRRQRDMLLAWRQESAKEATRIRSMWDLAEAAADRLPAMSIEEKAEVFAILAIRITVLDPPPDAPARGGRDGGYGPAKPPATHR